MTLEPLGTLPEALGRLVWMEKEVQPFWANRLESCLARCTPQELIRLEETSRSWWHQDEARQGWWKLDKSHLQRIEALSTPGQPHLLGLASFHPDGHVREAALDRLADRLGPAVLPYLLLRINEWVEPVQQKAHQLLESLMTPALAPQLVHNLRLVSRMQTWKRRDLTHTFNRLMDLLTAPGSLEALEGGLASEDHLVRRACAHIALDSGQMTALALLERTQRDPDPVLRSRVCRAVLEQLPLDAADPVLRRMGSDRSPEIRRRVLDYVHVHDHSQIQNWLESGCMDPSRSVRDLARYLMNLRGLPSSKPLYQAHLASALPKDRIVALLGVGEVGDAADAPTLVPFTDSEEVAERRAALEALGRLQQPLDLSCFTAALQSRDPGISRTAKEVLSSRRPEGLTLARLLDIYRTSALLHVKRNVLMLSRGLPKWQAMELLLEALTTTPEGAPDRVGELLEKWRTSLNRVPPPRGPELERARKVLQEARVSLGFQVLPELDILLSIS